MFGKGKSETWASLGDDCYYGLNGEKVDYEKAADWYLDAAKKKHPHATFMLGLCLELGRGVEKDMDAAEDSFIVAAKLGNEYAKQRIETGKLVEPPAPVEEETEEEETVNDEIKEASDIAYKFTQKKKYKEAFPHLEIAANGGDAWAQNQLGFMYSDGDGVTQDYAKALYWREKAANQGYKFAQNMLGHTYYYGKGVIKDYRKALSWYEKSAAQGDKDAKKMINQVTKELPAFEAAEAKRLAAEKAQLAAKAKAESAKAEIAEAIKTFKEYEAKGELASGLPYLKKAANAGDSWAKNHLGDIYCAFGQQFAANEDNEGAFEWFELSAGLGNAEAQYFLAILYATGNGTKENLSAAQTWLKKAADQGHKEAQKTYKQFFT